MLEKMFKSLYPTVATLVCVSGVFVKTLAATASPQMQSLPEQSTVTADELPDQVTHQSATQAVKENSGSAESPVAEVGKSDPLVSKVSPESVDRVAPVVAAETSPKAALTDTLAVEGEKPVSYSANDLKFDPLPASPVSLSQLNGSIAQSTETTTADPLRRRNGLYLTFYGVPIQGRKFAEDFIGRATFKTGGGLGGAIGYRFGDLRFDSEIAYFKNKFDELTFFQPGTSTPVPGPSETSPGSFVNGRAIMFNLYYDIPIQGSRLRPYVGGGVGFYNAYINDLAPPGFGGFTANGKSPDRFAYQLRAGLTYTASRNLDLFLGYRFFKGKQFEYTIENSGTPPLVLRPNGLQSHNLEVGLRYQF